LIRFEVQVSSFKMDESSIPLSKVLPIFQLKNKKHYQTFFFFFYSVLLCNFFLIFG
jgi:hypothetical protein